MMTMLLSYINSGSNQTDANRFHFTNVEEKKKNPPKTKTEEENNIISVDETWVFAAWVASCVSKFIDQLLSIDVWAVITMNNTRFLSPHFFPSSIYFIRLIITCGPILPFCLCIADKVFYPVPNDTRVKEHWHFSSFLYSLPVNRNRLPIIRRRFGTTAKNNSNLSRIVIIVAWERLHLTTATSWK